MNRKFYRKSKNSKKRTTLKIIITLALSVLICGSAYGIYLVKKAENAANNAFETAGDRDKSDLREEQVEPLHDNVSILFVGVDNSKKRDQSENTTRSDALVLATLNNDDKTIYFSVGAHPAFAQEHFDEGEVVLPIIQHENAHRLGIGRPAVAHFGEACAQGTNRNDFVGNVHEE